MAHSTTTRRRVTLASIAQDAGVSLSTISKVLNGRPDVSPSTRAHVEEQLTRHGYHRRRQAASSTALLELVVHELEPGFSLEIIRGVQDVARANGLGLVLTETGTRYAPGEEWIDGVLRRRPRGVVLVFSDLAEDLRSQLRSREIPWVILDPAGDPSPDVPSVGSSNWSGGLMATRHLIELGHQRIGVISGPEDMMCSLARVDGYRSAMTVAGLELDERLIRFGDFHLDGGRTIGGQLLDMDNPPTAIFAGSDLQALGVFEAARARGLEVPRDLSVVGYDDIPLAAWLSPALTTVHQPLRRMGEEAARLVLRAAAGMLDTVPRMDLATSLVVRHSTASPASASA
jgi:LacI family xylobiose transport system transcriptional regulator